MAYRTEKDSMGAVEVPGGAYYGAFTARAKENFSITGETPPRELIRAIAAIKKAAAQTNYRLGDMEKKTMNAITSAADEVMDGEFDDAFVLDMIQAGAGTPFHMNANEVIANRATEFLGGDLGQYKVHPNDDVNMGQSSNNVVPTAVRLAALDMLDDLLHELELLRDAFAERGETFDDIVKVGRTHLQDAVPVTLGQEFQAWASLIDNGIGRVDRARRELREIGLGGNAVGTGINTHPRFREVVVEELEQVVDRDLSVADDHIAMTQSMAPFNAVSSALQVLVRDMVKIADDLMLLSSGPVAGLHEIELPEVEPGSSIMPGKVNPSIVEAFKMALLQVEGDHTVIQRAAEEGDLEMNVNAPLIAKNLFEQLTALTNACEMMRERCVTGITADEERIEELFEGSTATATALSPYLGYDLTADVVHGALDTGHTIREVVGHRDLMTEEELDTVLDPERLTGPHGVDRDLLASVKERLDDR